MTADGAAPAWPLAEPPLLALDGVCRSVRLPDDSMLTILDGLSLTVRPGERVGIVGRSGSGKSTLLNILGLLDMPTAGAMFWRGTDVRTFGSRRSARIRGAEIGFVFQQFNLLPQLTALDNVAAPLFYAGGREFFNRKRIARAMLERLGLGERVDELPKNLSGGEQQRVAIARALVRRPKLVLADEPTGALDVNTGRLVMDILEEATHTSGAALVTITHDLDVAARSERRFRLDGGRLHAEAEDQVPAPGAEAPVPGPVGHLPGPVGYGTGASDAGGEAP